MSEPATDPATELMPEDFESCFLQAPPAPPAPPLAQDLARAHRLHNKIIGRRVVAASAVAAGVALLVALTGSTIGQTALPAAPIPTATSLVSPAPTTTSSSASTVSSPVGNIDPLLIANRQLVEQRIKPLYRVVTNDGGNDPHFADLSINAATRQAEIFWKGDQPAALRDLAGRSPSGVTVTITPARYSQRDSSRAAAVIFDAARGGAIPLPSGISLSPTGAKLSVRYPQVDIDRDGLPQLQRQVQAVTSVRLEIKEGGRFVGAGGTAALTAFLSPAADQPIHYGNYLTGVLSEPLPTPAPATMVTKAEAVRSAAEQLGATTGPLAVLRRVTFALGRGEDKSLPTVPEPYWVLVWPANSIEEADADAPTSDQRIFAQPQAHEPGQSCVRVAFVDANRSTTIHRASTQCTELRERR